MKLSTHTLNHGLTVITPLLLLCCNHLAFCQAWSLNEYVMLCYVNNYSNKGNVMRAVTVFVLRRGRSARLQAQRLVQPHAHGRQSHLRSDVVLCRPPDVRFRRKAGCSDGGRQSRQLTRDGQAVYRQCRQSERP